MSIEADMSEIHVIAFDEYPSIERTLIKAMNYPVEDFKCHFDFKRERDYPTLKQGLHDPTFKSKRR